MAALIVRGQLRRTSISGSSTVTFCSVHVHNKVAKKRDAPTSLLQLLYAHIVQHNVVFIGGDFNMSTFSTVGDFFSDLEFSAPGNALLLGIGGLDETCKDRTGFLIMPKRPYEWSVEVHGCYKFDNADFGFAPRDQTAHFPVFLHLCVTNLPGRDSITRSCQAQQRRLERAASKNDRIRHASNPLATQPKSSPSQSNTPPPPQCERLPMLHCCLACSTFLSGNTWSALSSTFP